MVRKIPSSCPVLSNLPLGNSSRVLRLGMAGTHLAGQVLGLSLPPDGPLRWYSISSAPGEPWVEVIYTLVDEGSLTPKLWTLRAGDSVWVQEPRGSFLDPIAGNAESSQKVWWIANGTGVSPFLSMIRDPARQAPGCLENRHLVFGCRTLADAYYLEEIALACRERNLCATVCLSAESSRAYSFAEHAGLTVHAGRLTGWDGLADILPGQQAMLCGSSGMINEVRLRLNAQGLPLESIFAEIYF